MTNINTQIQIVSIKYGNLFKRRLISLILIDFNIIRV